ncbi:MAG: peptidase [Nitrosopumilus sp.]|nr:peptidase [Nitrosopumilus sp.]
MRWLAAVIGLAIAASLPAAFGHGLGGDQAPPLDLNGRDVTVSTLLTPYDLDVDDAEEVNVQVKFFYLDNKETLPQVTYRIEIWNDGQLDRELLARNFFFDEDGRLDIKVVPKAGCDKDKLHQCTKYFGSGHTSAPGSVDGGALHVFGEECNNDNLDTCARPQVSGPIFVKGGLYNLKVLIEAATSSKALVPDELNLEFDTFVSVAQEQDFELPGVSGPEPIRVPIKTYYDDVGNFAFDKDTNTVSFDMEFDWSPDYVELVPIVHEEVGISPEFAKTYGTGFRGFVNGIEVGTGSDHPNGLLPNLDGLGSGIVHFLLDTKALQDIAEKTGQDGPGKMLFELVAGEPVPTGSSRAELVRLDNFEIPVSASVDVSWPSRHGYGDEIPFLLEFRDQDGRIIPDVLYTVELHDHDRQRLIEGFYGDPLLGIAAPEGPDGDQLSAITASEGIDVQVIKLPADESQYRLDVKVLGSGAVDIVTTHAGIGSALLDIGQSMTGDAPADPPARPAVTPSPAPADPPADPPAAPASIPAWIKTNAGLWVDGSIDDATFAGSLQFLINQGVISVGDTEQGAATSSGIPAWIKQSTGLWVDGQVDDATFAGALQFLIRQGIIQVG